MLSNLLLSHVREYLFKLSCHPSIISSIHTKYLNYLYRFLLGNGVWAWLLLFRIAFRWCCFLWFDILLFLQLFVQFYWFLEFLLYDNSFFLLLDEFLLEFRVSFSWSSANWFSLKHILLFCDVKILFDCFSLLCCNKIMNIDWYFFLFWRIIVSVCMFSLFCSKKIVNIDRNLFLFGLWFLCFLFLWLYFWLFWE